MSTKPKNRDHRGRRRGGPRRSDSPRRPDRPKPPCSICGEPIQDITSALSRPTDGTPVHFDCALQSVTDKLNPGEGEKVIYLGKGSFAVVEHEAYQKRSLKVSRRIDWENLEEISEWRRELRAELK
ncbi:MAG: hypothetical protein DRP60_10370 [Spirochaetes bacterium]|nr:MAG: hypothetical protein DRP60_10370 [Spirochaetota bacterium]